jgi:hypothetical protein
MMKPIVCKNCHEEIVQLPSGTWIDENGVVWCPPDDPVDTVEGWSRALDSHRVQILHQPIVPPEWAERIRTLAKHSPSFWTPYELAKLVQLSEEQITEILNG